MTWVSGRNNEFCVEEIGVKGSFFSFLHPRISVISCERGVLHLDDLRPLTAVRRTERTRFFSSTAR